jgi:retinol dehydrogenase 12
MSGKVAIVTGSNSGVGRETAAELAGKGYTVIFACRSKERAEEAIKYVKSLHPGSKTEFIQLDTGKMKTVKAFASTFSSKYDRLDVLVHNAGRGYFTKEERTTEDGLEAFFQTNYLGGFLLTKLLLDLLKKSNGRVICVSSIEHWEGSYDFPKVTQKTGALSYATSKLMLMLFAFELARREGIQAAAVNPGGVLSGIWWYLRGWKAKLWNIIAPLILLSCQQGCQTSVHAATVDSLPSKPTYFSPYRQWSWCPKLSDTINFYAGPVLARPDPRVYKEDNWIKLWEFSEEQIKPFL